MLPLNGKVAVITGATSGIGARTAGIFVAAGARVVIAGRRRDKGEALAATMNLTFFIFTFLSSVFYPSSNNFILLRVIFELNPLTYIADLVRNGLVGLPGFNIVVEAIVLTIESAVMLYFALRAINKIEI